ncbi:MAG TPA: cell division protein FtsZ [Caulobacteraceae bacterium]|jgi:cell division protein FtsZ
MAISFSAPRATELKPRIVVFGVGGAGGNAVNNMIEAGLEGVEFVTANTDAQQLQFAKTEKRIQLGMTVTQGLGAGAHPEVGMSAAEESTSEISEHLDGIHMVFITAGMGGGTGTGAAPVIAKCARERGILTVGVVTKPFHFEGRHRMRLADAGISELQRYVDTLIVIPNQNLFRVANEKTTFADAFSMADQVLHSGVRSITDLMVQPGLINLDFADVRTVMTEMGKAMMGTGEASGEDRALAAAQNAIQNPLLDEVSLKGAKAVLVNVTGGRDMTLLEVDEACNAISAEVDPDANTIFGAAFDDNLEGKIRVSVVATGMDGASMSAIEPKTIRAAPPAARPVEIRAAAPVAAPIAPPVAAPAPVMAKVEFAAEPKVETRPEPLAAEAKAEPVSLFTPKAPEPAKPEPDLLDAPLTGRVQDKPAADSATKVAATAAPAPVKVEPARPVARIVDPMVEDEQEGEDFDAPLVSAKLNEPQRGRFLSLFGARPRQEPSRPAQAPSQFRSPAAAKPAPAPEPDPMAADDEDDLEIPSFLRRLAN